MFLLLGGCVATYAQQVDSDIRTDSVPEIEVDTLVPAMDSVRKDTLQLPEWLAPRTVKYTIGRDAVNTYVLDTSLDNQQYYDPVMTNDFAFRNMGNYGLAAMPITYNPATPFGFDRGHHQYDLYLTSPQSIRWYDSKQSFTRLFLLIGQKKEQGTGVIHNQTIKQIFNFGFRFNRIASQGIYPNQLTNINDLAITGKVRSKNYRYSAAATFFLKRASIGDNGGVATTDIFSDTSILSSSIVDVNLTQAGTTIKENAIHLRQSVNFGTKIDYYVNDTTTGSTFYNELQVYHEVGFDFYKYRYFDNIGDSLDYPTAYQAADSVKMSFRDRMWTNRAGISYAKVLQADSADATYRNFYLDATVVHEVHLMEQVLNKGLEAQNLNLEVQIRDNTQSHQPFRYSFAGKLGIGGYNAGDQQFIGRAGYHFGKFGLLQGATEYHSNSPDWFTSNIVTSAQAYYFNFDKTQRLSVGFDYQNTKWRSALSGRYNVINNLIYWNEAGLPQQSNDVISFYTLTWVQNFRFWDMGLDNMIRLYVPIANTAVMRFPRYWGKQTLFYERDLFKHALRFRVGVDLFYNTNYQPYEYLPVVGQFTQQYNPILPYYPTMDVFINMQIAEVVLFFKMEHVNQGMFKQNGYFNAYPYPAPDRAFKVGLVWRFYN